MNHTVSVTTVQFCCCNMKATIDNMQTSECDCSNKSIFMNTEVRISYNFYISWNIALWFFFCQSLKIWKPFSPCRPYRNRIWPMGCSVLIPVLYHDLVVFPSYWYLKLSYLLFCFFCCLSLRAGCKLLEGTSFVLVTILSLSSSTVPQLWRCFMNIWWLNVFRKYFAAVVSLPVQTVTL